MVGVIYVPMGSYTKNIQFKTFWGEDPGLTQSSFYFFLRWLCVFGKNKMCLQCALAITCKNYISIACHHQGQDILESLLHFLHTQLLLEIFYQTVCCSNSF